MRKGLVTILLLASTAAWSATYYIDYTGGLNSNTGLSKTAAWKVHPYMQGFTGSYTHQAGDRFIFKGGVTWPNSVFGMSVTNGGASGNPDYYGVDKTWSAGNTWTRPVFDAQNTVIPDRCFMGVSASYVTIDNFEMTGFYWDSTHQGYGTCLIGIGIQTYITIKNCYFHNWSHATAASGCLDDLQVVLGNSNSTGTGDVIDSCVFDGAPNGANSGAMCYTFSTVRNSIIKNMSNGCLITGRNGEVSGCTIGPINVSFDPACHENGIEDIGVRGTFRIFNNVLFNTTAITLFVGGFDDTLYIYNNLIYNSQPVPILLETRGGSGFAYIYNNTISSVQSTQSYPCIDGGSGTWTYLDVRNNHFISEPWTSIVVGGTFGTKIEDHNITMTQAQATAAGYTLANQYKTISATSATVDAGVSLASVFTNDIFYTSRPQGAGWDIGAYEYTANQVRTTNVERRTKEMGIGFPSPLTVAHLRAWLSTEQTLVLSDLFGHVIDGNNPLSPGIYLVQTNGHAVQKVVVTE